jgi:hypothetical protein
MPADSSLRTKLLLWGLLLFSLYFLISLPNDVHVANQLGASPLCSVQEASDCVREIKVTVVSTSSGKSKRVTVTMPNGSDGTFRLVTPGGWSLDYATLSQLVPGQEVTARQWHGKIIYFITPWQNKISTSNDPHSGFIVNLVIGVVGTLIAGYKLWPDIAAFTKR